MVYTVTLSGSHGRIWTTKPRVARNGVLTLVANSLNGSATRTPFTAAAFAPSGATFTLADAAGKCYTFHVLSNRYSLLHSANGPPSALAHAAADLVIAPPRKPLAVVSGSTGAPLAALRGHRKPVAAVSVSKLGVLTVSPDAALLWDPLGWAKTRALGGESDDGAAVPLRTAALGDTVAVTVLATGAIVLWDGASFSATYQLHLPKAELELDVTGVALSGDDRYVLGWGAAPTLGVAVWRTVDGSLAKIFYLPAAARGVVAGAFVPPDGNAHWSLPSHSPVLALLCDNGVLYFVSLASGVVLAQIGGKTRPLTGFALSPFGRYCVALTHDGHAALYDLEVVGARASSSSTSSAASGETLVAKSYGPDATPAMPVPSAAEKRQQARKGKSSAGSSTFAHPSSAATGKLRGGWTKSGWPGASKPAPRADPPLDVRAGKTGSASALLSADKLASLLLEYGEYPSKYRLLIWRFLLQVPSNSEAFEALVAKGVHVSWSRLAETYPISSRKLFKLLERQVSALAHWAPIFGELSWLPQVVFPFVKLFAKSDDVVVFEVLATLLTQYTGSWYEYYPNPPINTLAHVEAVLETGYPELAAHFAAVGFSMVEVAWPLLSSLFTDVLTRGEWLKLMDHVFSGPKDLLNYIVAAYLGAFSSALLRVTSRNDLEFFLTHHNAVNLNAVLQAAYGLVGRAPAGPDAGAPFVALPPGAAYPIFNAYPHFVVNYQAKEHARIAADEAEASRKRATIEELAARAAAIEAEEAEWQRQQDELLKAEQVRRRQAAELEAQSLKQRSLLDAQAKEQRLAQLAVYEASRKKFMETQKRARAAELERLDEELALGRSRLAYEMRQRLEEEALLKLEFTAMQRLQEMEAERERESTSVHLRTEAEARRKQDELQEKMLFEAWRLEDEERKLEQELARSKLSKLASLEEQLRAKAALDEKYQLEQLEKDFALAEVKRERRLRQLAEDEANRIALELDEKRRYEELLSKQDEREVRVLTAEERKWRQAKEDERKRILERERRRQKLEMERRREKLTLLEKAQRRREFEEALEAKREAEEANALAEEKELQAAVLALDEERNKDRVLEEELLLKEKELNDKVAFQAKLRSLEQQVYASERARFAAFRHELSRRMELDNEEVRRQHELALQQAAVEREAKMAGLEAEVRARVEAEELAKLEADQAAVRARAARVRAGDGSGSTTAGGSGTPTGETGPTTHRRVLETLVAAQAAHIDRLLARNAALRARLEGAAVGGVAGVYGRYGGLAASFVDAAAVDRLETAFDSLVYQMREIVLGQRLRAEALTSETGTGETEAMTKLMDDMLAHIDAAEATARALGAPPRSRPGETRGSRLSQRSFSGSSLGENHRSGSCSGSCSGSGTGSDSGSGSGSRTPSPSGSMDELLADFELDPNTSFGDISLVSETDTNFGMSAAQLMLGRLDRTCSDASMVQVIADMHSVMNSEIMSALAEYSSSGSGAIGASPYSDVDDECSSSAHIADAHADADSASGGLEASLPSLEDASSDDGGESVVAAAPSPDPAATPGALRMDENELPALLAPSPIPPTAAAGATDPSRADEPETLTHKPEVPDAGWDAAAAAVAASASEEPQPRALVPALDVMLSWTHSYDDSDSDGESSSSSTTEPPPVIAHWLASCQAVLGEMYEFGKRIALNDDNAVYRVKLVGSSEDAPEFALKLLMERDIVDGMPSGEAQALMLLRGHPCIQEIHWWAAMAPLSCLVIVSPLLREDKVDVDDPSAVQQYMHDVISALAFTHKRGIVNRDIKPENIMYNAEERRAIVIDFDTAVYVRTHADRPTSPTGTIAFMAPEVKALDSHPSTHTPYDFAVDVFSAGIVFGNMLFESYNPKYPDWYLDFSNVAKLLAAMKAELAAAPAADYGVRSHLALDLLEKMIEADPGRRITAEQALGHPYFAGLTEREMLPVPPLHTRPGYASPSPSRSVTPPHGGGSSPISPSETMAIASHSGGYMMSSSAYHQNMMGMWR
ncbi:WD repeat-containing protein 67 [Thecamonas trahens ATCC 50062]|uniref:TBC1 domain family member 31 n=1 Tax=Thecamonas trahens ATCC 50062 TaxID=461836 RepID=A0A0L0D834_THETB|nr:WD repeat-containing protein 67 [Thecamonas trahens ATCC 50062]KNC48509.1 WD repeat-containing protein 67 [Thecamonas trahens ATCC 50062]|eukprot:XP_013758619.1 WD repeat-containing protein 67 [Thecamonas trahens ATCC 50062]